MEQKIVLVQMQSKAPPHMRKGVGTQFIHQDIACTRAKMTADFMKTVCATEQNICNCLERKMGMNIKRPSPAFLCQQKMKNST